MSQDARVRRYLDAAPDAIFVADATGCIEYASRRGASMVGVEGNLVGRELGEFIDPSDRARLLELINDGPSEPVEVRVLRPREQPVWVEATAEYVLDETGRPSSVLALRDVSRRKSAELELLAAKTAAEQANQKLEKAMKELEHLAATDELTGLWNRRHFEQVAAVELSRCRRYGHVASLVMLDVDHFKSVNDRFGHEVGDRVLVAVCRAIGTTARTSDTACRWGGEEFIVLASSVAAPGAWRLAERIRTAVAALDPSVVPGGVTISAGVAQLGDNESLEEWVERADRALYRAKQGGRNRVEVAPQPGGAPEHRVVQLVWDASYECGDAVIDEQHRELFMLGNGLLDAAMSRAPVEVQQQHLSRLLDHCVKHFADEEAMLARIGFPERERHAALHRALLDDANGMRGRMELGEVDLQDVMSFVVLRIVNEHLVRADSRFFPAVRDATASGG